MHNHPTHSCFVITPTNLGFYYHSTQSIILLKCTIKITHNLAYIRLEPKSSHTIKYSQPFELVLFHIIIIKI